LISLTRERKVKEEKRSEITMVRQKRERETERKEKETVLQNVCYTLADFRLKEENVGNSLE